MKQAQEYVDTFSVVIGLDKEASEAMCLAQTMGFSRESVTKYALKCFLTNIHRTHLEGDQHV